DRPTGRRSRMIPAPFAYHRPRSLDETLGLLTQHGEDARVVAGGHSLIPMMKLRLARPGHLVDLQDLEELRGIRSEPDAVTIGAMTTQHQLIGSELLTARCPIIRETALQIAGRIELGYLTFGNGIRSAIECHEDGNGRTAMLPT